MSEIEEFCDTVFVINRGPLVASGSVKELLKPHERIVRVTFQDKVPDRDFILRHEQIRKAEPLTADTVEITLAQDDSAWLNQCLQQAGFRVSAIAPKQKTLKEFFLSITGLRHAEVSPSINPAPSAQAGLHAPQGHATATQAGDKPHA
jgi:ABC-type multidrug transport system ATPase subunit